MHPFTLGLSTLVTFYNVFYIVRSRYFILSEAPILPLFLFLATAFDSLVYIVDLLHCAESRSYGSYLKCKFRYVECQTQCIV